MQIRKSKFNIGLYVCLSFLISLVFMFFACFPAVDIVKAEDVSVYTGALEDLQKDENFDINKFPVDEDDYSLKVVQIAESKNSELFVYVYEPAVNEKVHATTISFSTAINDSFYPQLYSLKLVSTEGTLNKYVVEDFNVLPDVLRYYQIVSIYRAWNELFDTPAPEGQTISEISFSVGQLWTACTVDNEVHYSYLTTETIEITDKFVGFVRYESGYDWTKFFTSKGVTVPGYDCHFIAFSTDHDIDRLMEVQVVYCSQSYHLSRLNGLVGSPKYGNIEDHDVTLTYVDRYSVDIPTNMYGQHNHYEWDRINSAQDFVNSQDISYGYCGAIFNTETDVKLTDEAKNIIGSKQFVVNFAETEFVDELRSSGFNTEHYVDKTLVSDVSILRLKFETDGVTYNLGVVDNKQTGSDSPVTETITEKKPGWLIWVIVGVVCFIVIAPFLPYIFKVVWWLLIWVFKGLWWLISLPFRLFKRDK